MWFLWAAFANDSVKAIVTAILLRRRLPGRAIRFDHLQDFWIYLAAAVVVAPALSGVAGAASWVALGRKFWPTWRDWFLGDALANLVITPLLLCLALDWRKFIKARPMRYLEGFVLFAGMFFAIQFAYQRGLNNPGVLDLSDYIPIPALGSRPFRTSGCVRFSGDNEPAFDNGGCREPPGIRTR
jgi:integral membrane sensor domain MASE1